MRSPILLPIRMKAAETSASSAIALCTVLTSVWRSCTTALIDTFMIDVSTTSTNMAMQRSRARRGLPSTVVVSSAIGPSVPRRLEREHDGELDDSGDRGGGGRGGEGRAGHAGRGAVRHDPRLVGDERVDRDGRQGRRYHGRGNPDR